MTRPSLGFLRYEDRSVPIVRIALERNELVFYGELDGTLPELTADDVVVVAPDGTVVFTATIPRVSMPPTYKGTLHLRQPVLVESAAIR